METGKKFDLNVETEYGNYHDKATIDLFFDEDSHKAFHAWLAEGCVRGLVLTRNGCTYPNSEYDRTITSLKNDLEFADKTCNIPWGSQEFQKAPRDNEYHIDPHYWESHDLPSDMPSAVYTFEKSGVKK